MPATNLPEIRFTNQLRFNTVSLVNRGCVEPCTQHHSLDEGSEEQSSPVLKQIGDSLYIASVTDCEFLLALAAREERDKFVTHHQQMYRIAGCGLLHGKSHP